MLGPGELYQLRKEDITWAGGRAVISLKNTKPGQRKGLDEMVVCNSRVANGWLAIALASKKPQDLLLDRKPEDLRAVFFPVLRFLQVQGYFSMYSFRRGGATWHFLTEGSMEKTLLRGRWVSTSTAGIYLQDAATALSHLSITDPQKRYMKQLAQTLSTVGQKGGLWKVVSFFVISHQSNLSLLSKTLSAGFGLSW